MKEDVDGWYRLSRAGLRGAQYLEKKVSHYAKAGGEFPKSLAAKTRLVHNGRSLDLR
jgi:hypothetical protein